MTAEEMQALSREAVVKLRIWAGPYKAAEIGLILQYLQDGTRSYYLYPNDGPFDWLHESTEACAEIMVRVLGPKGLRVSQERKSWVMRGRFNPCRCECQFTEVDNDPMQAFRIAVLRAVCAMEQ